jgi:DNA-directed RNA polymerase subunit M/transcription elongation factor TFIIS
MSEVDMSEIDSKIESGIIDSFSKKKENIDILKKYIRSYLINIDDTTVNDVIYEVGFLLKQENKTLKEVFDLLKGGKLFKNHSNFVEISKKLREMDEFMDKPFEVTEGVNVCNKCKSSRTLSYNRQTRSGDEGMTVYVFCIDCKYRYTMNS